ncbi:MAG: hypothetical protein N4A49_06905 [Marinifilaceae bacterium]|jgi:hypothetical protein|nr:hypothetical protein [Marinifilaceae bacterium]
MVEDRYMPKPTSGEFEANCVLFDQYNLIVETFTGDSNPKKTIDFHRGLMSSFNKTDQAYDLLIDMQNLNSPNTIETVDIYVKFFSEDIKKWNLNRIAVIANCPSQVVQLELFRISFDKFYSNFKIFSFVESALVWLGGDIEPSQVLDVINKMKNC